MRPMGERIAFSATLMTLLVGFFFESLVGDKVLSPGDVVFATASFPPPDGSTTYEPRNRLLMDPVLQFAPWLEFTRGEIRSGRLPLWNPHAGCGAPHLANGQSAVFDPFHAIAYLGRLPAAHAPMAAARLWVAGCGMFLLAQSWGFRPWGRWFAGLTYPFCGFLVGWLMYPVTSVAVWMPWLFWASDRVWDRGGGRRIATLGLIVGCVLLAGHVQTSAHVLLANGFYLLWRWARDRRVSPVAAWTLGVVLGVLLAAIEVVPLGVYLARSPVWEDRKQESQSPLVITKPRLLDAVCTALPYAYGSQRRGMPNLAPALGVNNLNESAGGFAGLATLIWLAPVGWRARRRQPRAGFLGGLIVVGAAGAFGVPPVANLLRALPVLDVADNRRLTLWVAFGLVLLGGIGLDNLHLGRWRWWSRSWLGFAMFLILLALGTRGAEPALRRRALAHYAQAAARTPGANPQVYRQRAEHQVRLATRFLPVYDTIAAGQLLILAGMARALRRRVIAPRSARVALIVITLGDLFGFGLGLNPAIPRGEDRPRSAVIAYLQREVPAALRSLGVGAELPPNLLMRYGLSDARNYDSIELSRSVDWFDPLFEPEPDRPSRTSRRTILWSGVVRARERLQRAGVAAVVGSTPPPIGAFRRVDRVENLWVARMEPLTPAISRLTPGEIRVDLGDDPGQVRWVAETFDPGWHAEVDGHPAPITPHFGAFLGVRVPSGARRLILRYDPIEVRLAGWISLATLGLLGTMAIVPPSRKSPSPGLDRHEPTR